MLGCQFVHVPIRSKMIALVDWAETSGGMMNRDGGKDEGEEDRNCFYLVWEWIALGGRSYRYTPSRENHDKIYVITDRVPLPVRDPYHREAPLTPDTQS